MFYLPLVCNQKPQKYQDRILTFVEIYIFIIFLDLIKYLDEKKPTFTCLYFYAAWNPICEKIEKDYENFCNSNA